MKKIIFIALLFVNFVGSAQSVSLDAIPQINCPTGTVTICGTYTMPAGGPYNVTFEAEVHGPLYEVTGGNQYLTSLTSSTFCLTIPMADFGANPPQGNYEISIITTFTLQASPFTVLTAVDDSTNPTGADIFLGNCPIIANDDSITFNECASGGTINVLTNDVFFGGQATTSNVVITQTSTSSQLTLNTTTGVAAIAANTLPGTYNIGYQICNLSNASQCDSGIVSVIITPAVVVATNDNFTGTYISSCSGGTTPSVLGNDTLCGNAVNATDFTVTLGSATPALPTGSTISNTGVITIPAGATANNYTVNYTICQNANPVNCSTANVTITVTTPAINAADDNFSATPINTLTGGDTVSVFTNDTVNGGAVNGANVTVALQDNTGIYGETISTTGIITIPPGTPNGTYTLVYTITQNGCSANSDTGTVTIVVNEQTINTPPLAAGVRANNIVSLVDTQGNGKIIIAGYFTAYNNIPCLSIARLKTDLTFDMATSFTVVGPTPSNQLMMDMKVCKNQGANYDKILLVGSFTGFNGGTHGAGIARLNPDGTIDTSFNPYGGVNRGASGSNEQIRTCYIYPDGSSNAGKILIGGMFDKYNNTTVNKIARLMRDGTIDPSFTGSASVGFNSTPQRILVQTDGKILIGGYFTGYNGITRNRLARLNDDGSLDTVFAPSGGATSATAFPTFIQDMVLQPDGNIIIGGSFEKFNLIVKNNIARVKATGLLDSTFNNGGAGFNNTVQNPVTGTYGLVRSLVLDSTIPSNLKVFVAGDFTAYNGTVAQPIIRLNCTTNPGTKDSFKMFGTGTNGEVWALKQQGDGKLIIGGQFTMFDVFSALNITRIAPVNGSSVQGKTSNDCFISEPEIDISDKEHNFILIYPNPSKGIFTFDARNFKNENFAISIYSTLGKKVYEAVVSFENSLNIDLKHLQKGIYFVSLNNDKRTIQKTIIIN